MGRSRFEGANEGFCELLCWMMGNYEGTRCGAAYEPLLLCPFVGCDLRRDDGEFWAFRNI